MERGEDFMKRKLVTLLLLLSCFVGGTGLIACDKDEKTSSVHSSSSSTASSAGVASSSASSASVENSSSSVSSEESVSESSSESVVESSSSESASESSSESAEDSSVAEPETLLEIEIERSYASGGNYCVVTGLGAETNTDIVIPETYQGIPVKKIGYQAFKQCSSITSITIPEGVTIICSEAFFACANLTSVSIPASVTDIDEKAFYACLKLTSVNIAENSSLGAIDVGTFANCVKLSSITIPASVQTIGEKAFEYCASLANVTVEEGSLLKLIDGWAFSGCSALREIVLCEGVERINTLAFLQCTNLERIIMPSSLTSIAWNAFANCYKLVEVINFSSADVVAGEGSDGNVGYYAKQVLNAEPTESNFIMSGDYRFYNANGSYYLIGYEGTETELTLPDDINGNSYQINNYAFYKNDKITKAIIPNGVTEIGASAFEDCMRLMQVTIGESVTNIQEEAFYNCSKLVEIINKSSVTIEKNSETGTYDGNIKRVITEEPYTSYFVVENDYIFYNFEGAYYLMGYAGTETDLVLPDEINGNRYQIHEYAFYKDERITSLTIGDGVIVVGESAFSLCPNLTQVTVSASVRTIEINAFRDCYALTNVTFESDSGWFITTDSTATSGDDISVTDTAQNAVNLSITYCNRYWRWKPVA